MLPWRCNPKDLRFDTVVISDISLENMAEGDIISKGYVMLRSGSQELDLQRGMFEVGDDTFYLKWQSDDDFDDIEKKHPGYARFMGNFNIEHPDGTFENFHGYITYVGPAINHETGKLELNDRSIYKTYGGLLMTQHEDIRLVHDENNKFMLFKDKWDAMVKSWNSTNYSNYNNNSGFKIFNYNSGWDHSLIRSVRVNNTSFGYYDNDMINSPVRREKLYYGNYVLDTDWWYEWDWF